MAYTARPLTTNLLQNPIFQLGHGFVVGDILTFDGANFVKAQANNYSNSLVYGMVSFVIDANTFELTQAGYITNLNVAHAGLTPGVPYFLDSVTPGNFVLTAPTGDFEVIYQCFYADTGNSGYFTLTTGVVIQPGGSPTFAWNTVIMDTIMQVNNGYIIDGGVALNMTLPVNFAIGDVIKIRGANGNGWVVKQNANQSCQVANLTTAVGVAGEIQSTANWNNIDLMGYTTNLKMVAFPIGGTPNVV